MSCCSNFERQTAQSPTVAELERRVMEEKVNSGSESIMEDEGASGEIRRLEEEKIGAVLGDITVAEEGGRRRRQRRLKWRRRKQRATERITVTASTITTIRMLGLRSCNRKERRAGVALTLLKSVIVSDPTTFSVKGGGEAIVS